MALWTQAEIDVVRAGWWMGRSASQIAVTLSEGGKITTRNAVMGIVHRGKLQRDPELVAASRAKTSEAEQDRPCAEASIAKPRRSVSVGEPKPRRRSTTAHKPIPPVPFPAPVTSAPPRQITPEGGVALMDLEHWHCRWVTSEAPYRFCGVQVDGSASWCPEHRLRVFDRRRREEVAA